MQTSGGEFFVHIPKSVGFLIVYQLELWVVGEANSSVTPHPLSAVPGAVCCHPQGHVLIILVYFLLYGVLLHKVRTLFLGLLSFRLTIIYILFICFIQKRIKPCVWLIRISIFSHVVL